MILPELSLWGKSSHRFIRVSFLRTPTIPILQQLEYEQSSYLCFAGEFNVTLDRVSTLSRAKLPLMQLTSMPGLTLWNIQRGKSLLGNSRQWSLSGRSRRYGRPAFYTICSEKLLDRGATPTQAPSYFCRLGQEHRQGRSGCDGGGCY